MTLEGQEFGNEVRKIRRLDAGVADGTDFFFIGKEGDLRLFARCRIEDGSQVGIRADAVVMAVGHDHRPVQADVAALDGGMISSSALVKSSSSMPYLSFNKVRIAGFVFSPSPFVPARGMSISPLMASESFLAAWSLLR